MCIKSTEDKIRATKRGHSGETPPPHLIIGTIFGFAFGLALCGQIISCQIVFEFLCNCFIFENCFSPGIKSPST